MATEAEVLTELAPNSQDAVDHNLALKRLSWTGPTLVLLGRSIFMILAQAIAATILALRRHPSPWNTAAPYWTVYATLVDIGCLFLIVRFAHCEDLRLRDLIGKIRTRWGHDFFLGLLCLAVIFPFFWIAAAPASRIAFGSPQPNLYPGLLAGRILPLWAVIYSLFIWWPIWSPTEELTYQGYCLPRFIALTRSRWLAVLIVGFWWALQHSFLPFILDWHFVLWRLLAFWPGCTAMMLLYLRIRRLPPIIVAHWAMDLSAVLITIKF
jgi:hypothetical protein